MPGRTFWRPPRGRTSRSNYYVVATHTLTVVHEQSSMRWTFGNAQDRICSTSRYVGKSQGKQSPKLDMKLPR